MGIGCKARSGGFKRRRLGIISAMNLNADYLREQIRTCRTLTDKPFGVNVMLMSPFVKDVAKVCAEEKPAVVTPERACPTST